MAAPSDQSPIAEIPGWFPWIDQRMFEYFLSERSVAPTGDLVELGVYLGKSAVLIGKFKAPGETFTVCDLFGSAASDDANQRENAQLYRSLDRTTFEQNYLARFDALPVIVQGLSSEIVNHVAATSVRFLHIDASHMYEHVVTDIASAQTMLLPDGVVVFDDYRTAHTPGVSAAVWEAVFAKGLHPVCITPQKLYGTFGDPAPHRERLLAWLEETGYRHETQVVAGAPIIRLGTNEPAKKKPAAPAAKPVEPRVAALEKSVAKLQAEIKALKQTPARRVARRIRATAAARKS